MFDEVALMKAFCIAGVAFFLARILALGVLWFLDEAGRL